jgi:hypothetical protein
MNPNIDLNEPRWMRRVLGLNGNGFKIRIHAFEITSHPRNCPASSDTRHNRVNVLSTILPDFWTSRPRVDCWIGWVFELLRHPRRRVSFHHFTGASNCAGHDQTDTRTWPELAAGLYDKLTGREAEISYSFDDLEIRIPSSASADAEHALWKMNGTIRVATRNGNPAKSES